MDPNQLIFNAVQQLIEWSLWAAGILAVAVVLTLHFNRRPPPGPPQS